MTDLGRIGRFYYTRWPVWRQWWLGCKASVSPPVPGPARSARRGCLFLDLEAYRGLSRAPIPLARTFAQLARRPGFRRKPAALAAPARTRRPPSRRGRLCRHRGVEGGARASAGRSATTPLRRQHSGYGTSWCGGWNRVVAGPALGISNRLACLVLAAGLPQSKLRLQPWF